MNLFNKPPEQVPLSPESRKKIFTDALIFRNRPEVGRVIFTSAPLRGSDLASNWLGRIGSSLIRSPSTLVDRWRGGIIASIPNLARHTRTPDGAPIPEYLANSNLRFQQWILDTCLRPYDQDWINYQQEIALRHTTLKKLNRLMFDRPQRIRDGFGLTL